jgi:hypothetical protein
MIDRRARKAIIRRARRTLAKLSLFDARSTLAQLNARLGREQPTRRLVRKTKWDAKDLVYKTNWDAKQ